MTRPVWIAILLTLVIAIYGCPCPVVTYNGRPAHGIRLAPESLGRHRRHR